MSKKSTKALASAALMSLVLTTALSTVPVNPVKAAAGKVTRTSGTDRYATAAQVATSNWTTSDDVVLVSGAGYADAVSASALAKKLNAPILLTTANSLSPDTKAALSTLKAKNVYVVGGNASVSAGVRADLKNQNYNLVELGGSNRYETNAAVAEKLVELGVDPSNVMLVGGQGFSDALSVAPIAAAKGQILLLGLNNADYMKPVIDFVQKHGSKVTVVGTTNVINDTIYSAVNATNRVDGGQDRFDTNLKVLNAFKDTVKEDKLFVANASGDGYADALVASALAGKTASPLVLVDQDGTAATNNAIEYIKDNATTSTDLNVVGGTGVVPESIVTEINNAVGGGVPGVVSVSSVTANSASSFQVTFSSAPADTSKVSFNVTRQGTPVTLTTTWDSTNTVATLTYSSNLPEDTYAVGVTNDTTDLGSTNVEITAQKINKIEVTSTTLGVTSPTTTGGVTTGGNGYALYKVLDQYGNDITTSGIAQGITWTCGVGTVSANNGLLTVTPFSGATNFLTQYTTTTINGVDQTTGVTTSANLDITQNQGTLSNITLNKLYCENDPNAIFADGDTSDTFYIDFTATDLSGNDTANYDLIKAGLMHDGNNNVTGLISSNPTACKVELVTDPSNSNNALIKVEPQSTDMVADQPVVITAFTSNGKSASINLSLKKSAQLQSLSLMAPNQTVCAGDTGVIIPFTAVDQNGATLTKYTDIAGKVTISGSFSANALQLIDNPDGTASLQLNVPSDAVASGLSSQSYTIQAVTSNTGKFSSINLAVQAKAIPNTLSVGTDVAVPNMESGAVQNIDFGDNFGGLAIKDQFGRQMNSGSIDMSNQDTTGDYYYVKASAPSSSSVTVVSDKAYNARNIQLKATGAQGSGSTTVTYTAMQHVQSGSTLITSNFPTTYASYKNADGSYDIPVSAVTPITQTYTVVKTTDIKDYTVGTINPVYDAVAAADYDSAIAPASGKTSNSVAVVSDATHAAKKSYIGTANLSKLKAKANVYGLTSSKGKVALANSDITSVSVDNSTDFVADLGDNYDTNAIVGVYGKNTLDNTKTTASGTLTVTIKSQDGLIHTTSTAVSSKDEIPVAQSVSLYVDKADASEPGDTTGGNIYTNEYYVPMTVVGNNVTMSNAIFQANVANSGGASNGIMSKYSADGNTKTSSLVYFKAVDQYGTPTAPFTTWSMAVKDSNGADITSTSGLSLSSTGVLTSTGTDLTGDTVTINGVANGSIQSVNIIIQGTGTGTGTGTTTNTLTGTFSSAFGQSYATATLPTGVTVTSVTKDGTTLVSGTDYSVSGTTLTILNATSSNVIKVTASNGTTYTITQ
ncbi:cell wall-binding repeat-containing protein [Clostridium sp. WILCCON 0269]|uniref:Cell wall-binding repeat-containing protein n=1 Tax=Candidatus Clostridium eludens TaxID=3381663 RepID=A0ABW8SEA9_9CLOT